MLKHGGSSLVAQLTNLISKIWDEEAVPQDFKDALIVHIYKRFYANGGGVFIYVVIFYSVCTITEYLEVF